MKISIVIPNYNGEELLRKNLPKVFSSIEDFKPDVEVVVVDDCSTDSSLDVISEYKNKFPGLRLLKNEKNFGFSSTVNKGVENSNGDIVVLLNTDAYPERNFLNFLIEDFKDANVFAVGCLDKSLEGGKVVLRGRGIGKWMKGFLVHSKGDINKNNTLWASGGSSAFRKEIWQKLGGLNTLYNPFYWEDIDISYRALKSGYKVLFDKRSVIYHNHLEGAIRKHYSEFQIKRIAYRNQIIFVWENATDLSLQFVHGFYLSVHLIKALVRGDFAFILGFIDAFALLLKIIKSSFKYQQQFVKKDEEVIKDFNA